MLRFAREGTPNALENTTDELYIKARKMKKEHSRLTLENICLLLLSINAGGEGGFFV